MGNITSVFQDIVLKKYATWNHWNERASNFKRLFHRKLVITSLFSSSSSSSSSRVHTVDIDPQWIDSVEFRAWICLQHGADMTLTANTIQCLDYLTIMNQSKHRFCDFQNSVEISVLILIAWIFIEDSPWKVNIGIQPLRSTARRPRNLDRNFEPTGNTRAGRHRTPGLSKLHSRLSYS